MKKLLLLPIVLLVLSGCTPEKDTRIDDLSLKVENLSGQIEVYESEKRNKSTAYDFWNFMEARIHIMLFDEDRYFWEEGGIRFYANVTSACISTDDIWQATPVPENFKSLPQCPPDNSYNPTKNDQS